MCGHRSISVHLIGMTDHKYKWSDYMTAHITSCRPVVQLTLGAHAQASYGSCFVFMSAFNTRLSARVVCGLCGARVSECTSIADISPCGGGVKRRRMKLVAVKSDVFSTLPF